MSRTARCIGSVLRPLVPKNASSSHVVRTTMKGTSCEHFYFTWLDVLQFQGDWSMGVVDTHRSHYNKNLQTRMAGPQIPRNGDRLIEGERNTFHGYSIP